MVTCCLHCAPLHLQVLLLGGAELQDIPEAVEGCCVHEEKRWFLLRMQVQSSAGCSMSVPEPQVCQAELGVNGITEMV
jgi:hypothetical protein